MSQQLSPYVYNILLWSHHFNVIARYFLPISTTSENHICEMNGLNNNWIVQSFDQLGQR